MSHNLTQKRYLKSLFNDLSVSEFNKALTTLHVLYEEKKIREKRSIEEEDKRMKSIDKIISQMKDLNISPDDLKISHGKIVRKAKRPVKDKYYMVDSAGIKHTWSGRGKLPKLFQAYMDENGISDKGDLPKL